MKNSDQVLNIHFKKKKNIKIILVLCSLVFAFFIQEWSCL